MKLTPGARFLAGVFGALSVPPIAAIIGKRLLEDRGIFFPAWAYVAVGILGWPAYATIRVLLKDINERRAAYVLGARVVPKVHGKLPGNLDILRQMMHNWRAGYPGKYQVHRSMAYYSSPVLGDGLSEVIEEKGPVFNMNVMFENLILTTYPEHLQIVLASDFQNYVKGSLPESLSTISLTQLSLGDRFQERMSSMLGVGVFNADGEMWKFHRQLTRPFFTRDRISHFELFDRHADTVMKLMKQRLKEGYPLDFQDVMARFTLDSAAEFLFGVNVHSLSATLPYPPNIARQIATGTETEATRKAQTFAKAFMEVQDVVATRERVGPLWPLLEILEDKSIAPMKIVNAFVEPIVAEAVSKKKAGRIDVKEKRDEIGDDETLLDHLVDLTDGRDTTSATLTFILYFLCIYPHVTARLREEILAKVGPTRRPTYDDIKDMKYLRAVINGAYVSPTVGIHR
ncbi:hypothetical protein VNI00_007127 [Paramarasmius palmivorus]|uniref:Cytochrome P450 n=1 Tax=Paramarasmius palmivorus TaxID=297713 RepID=A0AAW0D2V3_9AGAR